MSYRDQLQDTDHYDGWGDSDATDPRDYSREGEWVEVRTRRFPTGEGAQLIYRVPGTTCYCVQLGRPEAPTTAYALESEMSFF